MSMLAKLLKQYKLPWIGGAKETLAQAVFWVSLINFLLIALTAYNTTLRDYLPWLSFSLFITVLVVAVVISLVIEYKFIVPSIWAFRGKQMFEHESDVVDRLKRIEKKLEEANLISKEEK